MLEFTKWRIYLYGESDTYTHCDCAYKILFPSCVNFPFSFSVDDPQDAEVAKMYKENYSLFLKTARFLAQEKCTHTHTILITPFGEEVHLQSVSLLWLFLPQRVVFYYEFFYLFFFFSPFSPFSVWTKTFATGPKLEPREVIVITQQQNRRCHFESNLLIRWGR